MIRYVYEIKDWRGNFYIGQRSKNPINDDYMGSGQHIKNAIKKHGKEKFSKSVLVISDCTKKEIDKLEKIFIKHYKENSNAYYNHSDGGTGGNLGAEVNKKISQALQKENHPNWGKHHSDELRLKIGLGNKNKTVSEKTKKLIGAKAKLRTGEKNSFFGKKHSEDTILKLRKTKECKQVFVLDLTSDKITVYPSINYVVNNLGINKTLISGTNKRLENGTYSRKGYGNFFASTIDFRDEKYKNYLDVLRRVHH